MNYSELLDNVRNYTEVTSDVLSNSVVNVFITNIENQIERLLDSDSQRRYATSAFQANNSFLDVSGPEGGFSSDEIDYLRKKPFIKPIDLGPRILRSDTAVISTIVLWHCLNGNMKKYMQ